MTGKEVRKTPRNNGTGPVGIGPRDGRGHDKGGRGQSSTAKGAGSKTGGKKGICD